MNVRFVPKATELLRHREMTRSANSGHSHCSKKVPLFDHLVGGDQQFIRDAEAERLDAAKVDPQVELGRAVHAKRGRHSASMSVRSATEIRPCGSIADSCRGAHMSGGLSHRRPKTIVDQVPPESIRAAARDIACCAFDVHVLAVGTCAIN